VLAAYAKAFLSPEFSREMISGSGPYKLVEWVDGQRIVLAKKQNWWGDKLTKKYPLLEANPDTIILLPIPDQTAAITALKDESIDVGLELDPAQFKELQSNTFVNEIYNLSTPPRYVYFYVAMNNKNPKLSDKRVRRALAHTLDMDAIIQDLYDGFGERVVGPFLPDKPYYHKGLKPVQMNLDTARYLLAAAGWTDSNSNGTVDKIIDGQLVEMKLQYLQTPGSAFQDNFTEVFRANAAKAGIQLEKVQVEANVLGERLRNRDYEVANRGAGSGPWLDDPKQLFHTDSDNPGGTNYARFGNAESDAIIDDIRNAPNEKTRNELYLKFQELLYEEQPLIFQFAPLEKLAVHKRFSATVTRKSPGVSLQSLRIQ
jgi:peptide/nickel transport system substrate-binding protein